MNETPTFLRALLLGFSIAAPVGPIGLLVIRRSLTGGATAGFVSGLGAAVADALYAVLAALGLGALSAVVLGAKPVLQVGGGLFLCWLGVATWRAEPAQDAAAAREGCLFTAFASTFLLTVTNPMTVLSFAAVFAGLGLGSGSSGPAIVAGVFLGSAAWWLSLSAGVGALRRSVTASTVRWVNRASGLLLGALGVLALVTR